MSPRSYGSRPIALSTLDTAHLALENMTGMEMEMEMELTGDDNDA